MRQSYMTRYAPHDKKFDLSLIDNLACYSLATSILLIRYMGIQDLDDATFDQALDLFDSTKPHFAHFWDTCATFEETLGHEFTDEQSNPLLSSFFWHDRWFGPNTSRLTAVLRLLRMYPGEPTTHSVNTIFNKYAADLLRANVSAKPANATPWDDNMRKRYTIEGTMAEMLFQMGHRFDLEKLPRDTLQNVDLTLILLICIGLSRVGQEEITENSVAQLLKLGADANGLGYAITPLQIATDIRSVSIVEMLLKK